MVSIKEIHDDFRAYPTRVQAEALKNSQLLSKGFKLNSYTREDERVYLEELNMVYPDLTALPKTEIIRLCRKYNLVWGKTEYYIHEIPQDCQEAIANFSLRKSNFTVNNDALTYREAIWNSSNGRVYLKDMEDSHLKNAFRGLHNRRNTHLFKFRDQELYECMQKELVYRGYNPYLAGEAGTLAYILPDQRLTFGKTDEIVTNFEFIIVGSVDVFDADCKYDADHRLYKEKKKAKPLQNFIQEDPIVFAELAKDWYAYVCSWGDDIPLDADIDIHNFGV